jgi:hypothetical protein
VQRKPIAIGRQKSARCCQCQLQTNSERVRHSRPHLASPEMKNLSAYCASVRFIADDATRDQYVTGYCINQIFFIACLAKCIFDLKKVRSHAAREGNRSSARRGRTRAVIAAIFACVFGIAYSTVIFAYKQDMYTTKSSTKPSPEQDQMRRSSRALQIWTACL